MLPWELSPCCPTYATAKPIQYHAIQCNETRPIDLSALFLFFFSLSFSPMLLMPPSIQCGLLEECSTCSLRPTSCPPSVTSRFP